MKLHELVGVEEEKVKHVTNVMDETMKVSLDVKDMIEMVRKELTGNERDLAMVAIGTVIKNEENEK